MAIISISAEAVRRTGTFLSLILHMLFISSPGKGITLKIKLFRYDVGIVTPLSISYDEYRRPRRDAPAADRGLNLKKLPALSASERP